MQDFFDNSAGIVLLSFDDANPHLFIWRCALNKYSQAVMPRHCLAAISQLPGCDLDSVANCQPFFAHLKKITVPDRQGKEMIKSDGKFRVQPSA
jgi:hypothetical protein